MQKRKPLIRQLPPEENWDRDRDLRICPIWRYSDDYECYYCDMKIFRRLRLLRWWWWCYGDGGSPEKITNRRRSRRKRKERWWWWWSAMVVKRTEKERKEDHRRSRRKKMNSGRRLAGEDELAEELAGVTGYLFNKFFDTLNRSFWHFSTINGCFLSSVHTIAKGDNLDTL